MINPTRVGRHVIALAFAVMVATMVASVVNTFSRVAAIIVFATIVLVWFGFAVSFARRQVEARGRRLGAFANPAMDSRSAPIGVSLYHARNPDAPSNQKDRAAEQATTDPAWRSSLRLA